MVAQWDALVREVCEMCGENQQLQFNSVSILTSEDPGRTVLMDGCL